VDLFLMFVVPRRAERNHRVWPQLFRGDVGTGVKEALVAATTLARRS
jgi:hypothetical protein